MQSVRTNDTVRFGITTHDLSGVLASADTLPGWAVFEEASDTPILQGDFAARVSMVGTYRGTFAATTANGFDNASYYEIHASGLVDGNQGRAVIKAFVLNDIYDTNVVQVTGDPVTSTEISEYHAPPTGISEAVWTHDVALWNSGEHNPIYYATTKFVKDYTTNSQDEYSISWYRNNLPVASSDITNPAMSVYNTSTGAFVVTSQTMDYANDLGILRYDETTAANILKSGEPYIWTASGVIDGATREWRQLIGIDLL